jgi:RIO-like serine/threonine protein kinase
MEHARSLLAKQYPTINRMILAGELVNNTRILWVAPLTETTVSKYHVRRIHIYYSIAYPDTYKRVFPEKSAYTERDVEVVMNDYSRQQKKVNDANERDFKRAMRVAKVRL